QALQLFFGRSGFVSGDDQCNPVIHVGTSDDGPVDGSRRLAEIGIARPKNGDVFGDIECVGGAGFILPVGGRSEKSGQCDAAADPLECLGQRCHSQIPVARTPVASFWVRRMLANGLTLAEWCRIARLRGPANAVSGSPSFAG